MGFIRQSLTVSMAALLLSATLGATYSVRAADQDLPELGSPANAVVSLDEEYSVGLMIVRGMRDQGQILDDPEVSEYIQSIGHRLSSHAEQGEHQFYYFVVRDPAINAFALPGGFVAVNSGLVLATRHESELAGVLAHETAHVTQRHLVRGLVEQSHAGLISTAAMLAAILLGATAGRGSPDAMEGAILATQGAAIQHQINYTRSQENEADRVGIGTMAAAGFDPLGMPTFFETLSRAVGETPNRAYEFLMDHPVTSDRIAESRSRAEQFGRIRSEDSESYGLTRERLRTLIGGGDAAKEYYIGLTKNGGASTPERRYGRAIAQIATGSPQTAVPELRSLVAEYPKITQYYSALGQAQLEAGDPKGSQATLEQALDLFPRNVPVTIRLAETLMRTGDNKQAHHVLLDLFNVVEPTPEQARLIAKAANAAGDVADSYYYMSEFYIMSGELMMASNQLQLALGLPDTNAIQRARFSARLEEVRAAMPKPKRQTASDDDDSKRGGSRRGPLAN